MVLPPVHQRNAPDFVPESWDDVDDEEQIDERQCNPIVVPPVLLRLSPELIYINYVHGQVVPVRSAPSISLLRRNHSNSRDAATGLTVPSVSNPIQSPIIRQQLYHQ